MILADKIVELRKREGLSQEELAQKVGVSRQAVSKWESARSTPDINKILALSELFGVSTDYLLKDEVGSPGEAPAEASGREAASDDEALLEEGDSARGVKSADSRLTGPYWSIVTAAYLAISFLTGRWGETWVIWPVAGAIYGAARQLYQSRAR